nr:MAG TPA: hypothetical protein [Caudoviricetes sp.]
MTTTIQEKRRFFKVLRVHIFSYLVFYIFSVFIFHNLKYVFGHKKKRTLWTQPWTHLRNAQNKEDAGKRLRPLLPPVAYSGIA